jgi:hypothetical protein
MQTFCLGVPEATFAPEGEDDCLGRNKEVSIRSEESTDEMKKAAGPKDRGGRESRSLA